MRFGLGRGGGKGNGASRRQSTQVCGNCICPNCNTVIPHKRGVPCFQTACPNCGAFMARKFEISTNED